MSSKLASSTVSAIYYDKDEDKTYIFATHPKEGFVGFCSDGPVMLLDDAGLILKRINEERLEELRQLKSIEETVNGRETKGTGSAAGTNPGSGANPVSQVGGGVHQP